MSEEPAHILGEFSRQWESGLSEFTLQTSGSTGPAKTFALLRDKIIWSCERTAEFLEVQPDDRIFCCLPTEKISGFMQLARAKVWGIGIHIAAPSGNPMLNYDISENCSITSITPMQLFSILKDPESAEKFQSFKKVLIGGAGINFGLDPQQIHPRLFHTYGMTETYSHIAFRLIDGINENYMTIRDTEIRTGADKCLQVKNFLTDGQWLKTNDEVEIQPDGSFRFLGRADIMINSGGLKINPMEVEALISRQYHLPPNSLLCSGIPDQRLGEKLVVHVLKQYSHLAWDFSFIEPALRPREILFVDEIPLTDTGKVRRY